VDPQRLAERDRRLLAGEHPGLSDHSYRLACRHAERLGAAAPTRLPRGLAESVVPHPLGLLQRVIVDVDDHVSEGEVIGEQLAKLRGVVKQPDAAVVGAREMHGAVLKPVGPARGPHVRSRGVTAQIGLTSGGGDPCAGGRVAAGGADSAPRTAISGASQSPRMYLLDMSSSEKEFLREGHEASRGGASQRAAGRSSTAAGSSRQRCRRP